jgi:hypothetical protein
MLQVSDGGHLVADVTDIVHGASQQELRILFPAIPYLSLFVVDKKVIFTNLNAITSQLCL